MRYLLMFALCTILLEGCATQTPSIPLYGKWGGVGVELDLHTAGGTLSFDCATGTIIESLKPNANGNFTVKGTLTSPVGPPVLNGHQSPTPEMVTYSGQILGNSLSFNIRKNQGEKIGNYSLEYNKPANLHRCL